MFTAPQAHCTEKTFAQNFSSNDESAAAVKCIIDNKFKCYYIVRIRLVAHSLSTLDQRLALKFLTAESAISR